MASAIKPQVSVMDVVLKGGALSAALAAPSKWSLNPSEIGVLSSAALKKTCSVQALPHWLLWRLKRVC